MKRPDSLALFDVLYLKAAMGEREATLFGSNAPVARQAFADSLIGEAFPDLYFEFPLLGNPCFDILTIYDTIDPNATFRPGAGYGYQDSFEWYASVRKRIWDISIGFEFDTSSGPEPVPGIYFQPRDHTELVRPFLDTAGEGWRADSYLALASRMPAGWPLSYIGLFPGRPGTPMRVGGYLDYHEKRRCAQHPERIATFFDTIGFSAYDHAMVEQLSELMRMTPSLFDFQLDIMPDGSLGPTFSVDISFKDAGPSASQAYLTDNVGGQILGTLESWGAADERWKLLGEAPFGRVFSFEEEDGTTGQMALYLKFDYAKAKWRNAVLQPAKFYYLAKACELEEELVVAKPE